MRGIRARGSDRGATLILVLIIITTVGLVTGAILTEETASVKTTVALRDQTADNYGGNAAAQAGLAQLTQSTFDCSTAAVSTTFGTSGTPFYQPTQTQGGPRNASVKCTPDTANGVTTTTVGSGEVTIDDKNTLGYAVLTTGTNTGQTYGQVCVAGGSVISNSFIQSGLLQVGLSAHTSDCANGTLQTNAAIKVTAASPTGCNGAASDSNAHDYTPTPCISAAGIAQGGAGGWGSAVAAPTSGYNTTACVSGLPANCGVNPAPLCANSNKIAAFRPGKYTALPGAGSTCAGATTVWFTPGVYYFDFAAPNTTWSWPATLIGGTPQDASGNIVSSLVGFDVQDQSPANKTKLTTGLAAVTSFPGACADPALTNDLGVEFVFGGSGMFQPKKAGHNEICASYSADTRPVAIYGVSRDVDGSSLSLSGGGSVSAQTLCASPPCTSTSTNSDSQQSMIVFDSSGQNSAYIHGYLYAPSAPVYFRIKNSDGILLGWGVVFRSLDIGTNGASPNAPYIAFRPTLHEKLTTITSYTIGYIEVWTCPASATPCATPPGQANVLVKFKKVGSTYKVLSWNNIRKGAN